MQPLGVGTEGPMEMFHQLVWMRPILLSGRGHSLSMKGGEEQRGERETETERILSGLHDDTGLDPTTLGS